MGDYAYSRANLLLFDQTLGADAASIDTAATIPGGYATLIVKAILRSSQAVQLSGAHFVLNNDTGTTYTREWQFAQGSTQTSGSDASVAPSTAMSFNVLGDSASSGAVSFAIAEIFAYSQTTFHKTGVIQSGCVAANGQLHTRTSWEWASTAAVNRVALVCDGGGNLRAGSRLLVYGAP